MTAVHGVLVVDKPAGPTSFEVVKRVRRALGADRAGHAGTLDPAATGVLAVCVGEGVKLQQFLSDGDKAYEAVVAFGAATETEDAEGKVVARADPGRLDAAVIAAALPRFTGLVSQVPPMYSAVHVGGRRLHEVARAGGTVERPARTVRVHALELVEVGPPGGALLQARLRVRCGKGTYVRTLAADLGRALDVPAHLAALRRTEAGPFRLDQAVPLAEIERLGREDRAALARRVLPLAEALGFPRVPVDAPGARDLANGKALPVGAPEPAPAPQPEAPALVSAVGPDGRLVAVCAHAHGCLKPLRVFAAAVAAPAGG